MNDYLINQSSPDETLEHRAAQSDVEVQSSLTEFAVSTAQNNFVTFSTFGMWEVTKSIGKLYTHGDTYFDETDGTNAQGEGVPVRTEGLDFPTVPYTMEEYKEERVISERVALNADRSITPEQAAVQACVNAIMRRVDAKLGSVLTTTGNYDSANVSSATWTTSAIDEVRKKIHAIAGKKGIRPDTLLLDGLTYTALYKYASNQISVDYPLATQLGVLQVIPFDTVSKLSAPILDRKAVLCCVGDTTEAQPMNKFIVPLVQRSVNFAVDMYTRPDIGANVARVKLNFAIVVADKDLAAYYSAVHDSTDPFA